MPAEKDNPNNNIEEWVLPDHSWDADLDLPLEKPEKPAPERGPDGRFLPAEKPAETPAKHQHTAYLSQMALELGMTQDEIDQTPTDSLGQTVRHLHKKTLEMHERDRRLAPTANGSQSPQTPPPPPEDDLAELGELKDELDPRFTAFLRRLVKENRELKAQVGEVRGHIQQKATETRDQWIDRLFDEQGDPDKFGKKSEGKGLTQDQLLSRRQIVMAARLQAGPEADEKQFIELIPSVLKKFGGGKSETPPVVQGDRNAATNGKPRVTPEEWDEAGLSRPTQRRESPEPKGTRRAERAVIDKLRDMNIPLDEEGGIEEAGIPE